MKIKIDNECIALKFFNVLSSNQPLWAASTVFGLMLCMVVSPVAAAPPPSTILDSAPPAGTILDSVKQQGMERLPRVPDLEVIETRPAMQKHKGYKVWVNSFRITGSTIFSEAELLQQIRLWTERELALADLQKVTDNITSYYRGKGYFSSRAYLPVQEIIDGVVEISVLEGRISDIALKLDGKGRLSSKKLEKFVDNAVKTGDVAYMKPIERALLLLDDLPAIDAKATLVPGASVGTSDLIVEATQKGTFEGSVDLDNFGNRYTGETRLGGTISMNNPARAGDQLTFRGLTAGSGLVFGRVSYLMPVGDSGTKVGGAYSDMTYALGEEFSFLDAEGKAQIFSLYGIHPFIRSRNLNVYGTAGVDMKNLESEANGVIYQDRSTNVYTIGVTGDSRDSYLGGGLNTFSTVFSSGTLDLDFVTDKNLDDVSARAAGGYNKIGFQFARLQRLSESLSGYLSLSGQLASKNLDSSEKFIVGGVSGVGAYPQGEAASDEAYMINAEVRWDLPVKSSLGNMQLTAFVDTASVRLHKELWTNWEGANANLKNEYTLSGAGLGFNVVKPNDYMMRLMFEFKIGDNDGADVQGNDSDGTDDSSRAWLQFIKWF